MSAHRPGRCEFAVLMLLLLLLLLSMVCSSIFSSVRASLLLVDGGSGACGACSGTASRRARAGDRFANQSSEIGFALLRRALSCRCAADRTADTAVFVGL